MVILSCLELEEKKFSLLLKREVGVRFWLENATFSNKLNFFSLEFWFFFMRQFRMTILDCCISLKIIKKFGCVGSCKYVPASVKQFSISLCPFFFESRWNGKSWKDIPASVRREFNFNDSTLLAWFVRRTPQSFFGFSFGAPSGTLSQKLYAVRLPSLPARSLVETDVPWFVFEIHSGFH